MTSQVQMQPSSRLERKEITSDATSDSSESEADGSSSPSRNPDDELKGTAEHDELHCAEGSLVHGSHEVLIEKAEAKAIVDDHVSVASSVGELDFDVESDTSDENTSLLYSPLRARSGSPSTQAVTPDVEASRIDQRQRKKARARPAAPKVNLQAMLELSTRSASSTAPCQLNARGGHNFGTFGELVSHAQPLPPTRRAPSKSGFEADQLQVPAADLMLTADGNVWLRSSDLDVLVLTPDATAEAMSSAAHRVSIDLLDYHVWRLSQEHESVLSYSHERAELNDENMRSTVKDCYEDLHALPHGTCAVARALHSAQSAVRAEDEVIAAYVNESLNRRQTMQSLIEEFNKFQQIEKGVRDPQCVKESEPYERGSAHHLRALIAEKDSEIQFLEERLSLLRSGGVSAPKPKESMPELLRLREEAKALSLRVQAARCGTQASPSKIPVGLTACR